MRFFDFSACLLSSVKNTLKGLFGKKKADASSLSVLRVRAIVEDGIP
jgi:hypothetical protein